MKSIHYFPVIAALFVSRSACGDPLVTEEKSATIDLPVGYAVEAVSLQKGSDGTLKPFLVLRSEGAAGRQGILSTERYGHSPGTRSLMRSLRPRAPVFRKTLDV